MTPLHRACENGDIDVAEILIKNGADIHKENSVCKNPFLY